MECKRKLLENMKRVLDPIREKYNSFTDNDIMDIAIEGSRKAREVAEETMEKVRKAVNLLF